MIAWIYVTFCAVNIDRLIIRYIVDKCTVVWICILQDQIVFLLACLKVSESSKRRRECQRSTVWEGCLMCDMVVYERRLIHFQVLRMSQRCISLLSYNRCNEKMNKVYQNFDKIFAELMLSKTAEHRTLPKLQTLCCNYRNQILKRCDFQNP